jgi:WD40 repeat protein
VWNLEQLVQKLPAHTNAVTCLAANEVKSIVASGGLDGILNVWQVENSQLVADKQL